MQGTIYCFSLHEVIDSGYADNFKCSKPGDSCKSCNQTKVCVDLGNYEFIEIDGEYCEVDKNEFCLKGKCTNGTNPYCPPGEKPNFPCKLVGVFPDPFDCQVFHICCDKTGNSTQHSCPEKYGYDPLTTYCKIRLPTNLCPDTPPVPICTKSGERGAILTNKTIYYICTKIKGVLYPVQYLCPNGKIFVVDTCVNK